MINIIIFYNSGKDDPSPLTTRLDNAGIRYTLQDVNVNVVGAKADQTAGVMNYKSAIMEILTRIRSIT